MTNRLISNSPRANAARCAHRETESIAGVFGLSKMCDVCESRIWNLFDAARCTGKCFALVNSSTIDNPTRKKSRPRKVFVRTPLPVYFMRGEQKTRFIRSLFINRRHTRTHALTFFNSQIADVPCTGLVLSRTPWPPSPETGRRRRTRKNSTG